jgi:hypothetical protein
VNPSARLFSSFLLFFLSLFLGMPLLGMPPHLRPLPFPQRFSGSIARLPQRLGASVVRYSFTM